MNGPAPSLEPPESVTEVLLFGIGNSGRRDDGLGWAFLDRVQGETPFAGRVEYRYQLQVEDAALVNRAEHVVFVDACEGDLPEGFRWQPCEPSRDFEFTTHALPPGAVLHLCRELYGKTPEANVLTIRGSCWDLQTGLSPQAERCLDQALRFFREQVLA